MRKKLTKQIEQAIPRVYDEDGEPLPKKPIANKIIDAIPYAERLNLLPFERWIPFACSSCHYNDANRLGCTYGLYGEDMHNDNQAPENCPLEY